ncbi:MAG: hypothetical protein ACOC10_01335 [Bacteroidota bacterium]
MTKKKKKQGGTKQETPKQAIIKRGRNLEFNECWINRNWVHNKMANIVISRKHSNGNITLAVFLVDLFLKGVKDVAYRFNMPFPDYEDFLSRYFEKEVFVEANYALAHNIIYGAVEFAEDAGYKPHPDFSVARYLLEEDNEQIALVNVAFGYKGKHCLLVNYDENYLKDKAHLEGQLNPGDYYVFNPNDFRIFHDPENEIFIEPEFDLETYTKKVKDKTLKFEDLMEVIENAFYLELQTSEKLQAENTPTWYPQDIFDKDFSESIGWFQIQEEDQPWFFELNEKVNLEKPKKLKKLRSKFDAFFDKYPEAQESMMLGVRYFNAIGEANSRDSLLHKLVNSDDLSFYTRNELAGYYHQEQQYDLIMTAYNQARILSDLPYDSIPITQAQLFFYFAGIYFLSHQNVRQAGQYMFLLNRLATPDDVLNLEKMLQLKIASIMASKLGPEVSEKLPKVFQEPL